jgi:hypothetical protein
MINPDHISESLETFYRVKYLFFYAYPGSGINILDPEKLIPDPVFRIRIWDPVLF